MYVDTDRSEVHFDDSPRNVYEQRARDEGRIVPTRVTMRCVPFSMRCEDARDTLFADSALVADGLP